MMNNLNDIKAYYNKKPVEYIVKETFNLKEDNVYVPRFKLKDVKEINDLPINEPIKPSNEVLIKAIKYGMVFLITYKGAKDKHFAGNERVIYPLVIGKSSKGKILLRGYHLKGWSVSSNRHMTKIWRLFRVDRILSITFIGSFFRLPPSGYNMNDKGMRGGIIAKADFTEIRKNQYNLVKNNQIQNKDDITLSTEDRKFVSIKVSSTETKIDLKNPYDNPYINNFKDTRNLRISFLKSIYGNKYVAVLNSIGQPGNTVKVISDKGFSLGIFKVLDSINGDVLKRIKNIKGNTVYDLYIFKKKI